MLASSHMSDASRRTRAVDHGFQICSHHVAGRVVRYFSMCKRRPIDDSLGHPGQNHRAWSALSPLARLPLERNNCIDDWFALRLYEPNPLDFLFKSLRFLVCIRGS